MVIAQKTLNLQLSLLRIHFLRFSQFAAGNLARSFRMQALVVRHLALHLRVQLGVVIVVERKGGLNLCEGQVGVGRVEFSFSEMGKNGGFQISKRGSEF